jgi:erythromycin esterase
MRAYVEIRDEGMSDNVDFLIDELYPGEKLIVWAHNFHVRHDNAAIPPVESVFPGVPARSMGAWLADRHRDELYTIGVYAYSGSATNNSDEVYEIAEPGAETTAWMFDKIVARYNGTEEIRLIREISTMDCCWLRRPRRGSNWSSQWSRLYERRQDE